jgi:hypothetical protein
VPDLSLAVMETLGPPWLTGTWAYVGLGPGQEFIPSFLALLGLMSAALLAILQWPVLTLLRRLKRGKNEPQTQSDPAKGLGTPAEDGDNKL